MAKSFDLTVIGSGPGGYVAAIRAAQLGLQTAVIEKAELGGICLNWGCIPTKALLHSATLFNHIKNAGDFGINTADVAIDFPKVIEHSRSVAARLSKGIDFLFRKNGITSLIGTAKIVAPGKTEITSLEGTQEIIESKNIIIATGARARCIPGITFDNTRIVSSREAMIFEKIPQSLIIIGAGAIGVEFAYFYASMGTKVTLIEMMPHILPLEDREVAEVVARSFKKIGIQIFTDTKVEKVEKIAAGINISTYGKNGEKSVAGECGLVAIGVQGNIDNIGLETIGVKSEKGFIIVDKKTFQTNILGIYAIGDVIGPPWLAHVASAEGIAAVENISGCQTHILDYDNIPACTYCQPQVASFGLTEEKALNLGREIRVGRFPFRANGKSLAMGESDGLVKLIFDAKDGQLLGSHIVGAEATELLAETGMVKTLGGTADDIIHSIHAHPTLSEAIKEAAENAYQKAIHI